MFCSTMSFFKIMKINYLTQLNSVYICLFILWARSIFSVCVCVCLAVAVKKLSSVWFCLDISNSLPLVISIAGFQCGSSDTGRGKEKVRDTVEEEEVEGE